MISRGFPCLAHMDILVLNELNSYLTRLSVKSNELSSDFLLLDSLIMEDPFLFYFISFTMVIFLGNSSKVSSSTLYFSWHYLHVICFTFDAFACFKQWVQILWPQKEMIHARLFWLKCSLHTAHFSSIFRIYCKWYQVINI
mgnify:FL=1